MDYSMPKMLIFMFTVSLIFTMANTGMAATFGTATGDYTIDVSNITNDQNLTSQDVDIGWGFLGPLLIIWDFIKKLGEFFLAPVVFLYRIGAPSEIITLIGTPWAIAWVFALASFVRGWRA